MLSKYNLRTVMTSKMQIIDLHFLSYLIKFLLYLYEILENNKINDLFYLCLKPE